MDAIQVEPPGTCQVGNPGIESYNSVIQLRQILGAETANLIANALRFVSLQTGIRGDRKSRQFYDDAAKLFGAVAGK